MLRLAVQNVVDSKKNYELLVFFCHYKFYEIYLFSSILLFSHATRILNLI